jgi:hypothetical protein
VSSTTTPVLGSDACRRPVRMADSGAWPAPQRSEGIRPRASASCHSRSLTERAWKPNPTSRPTFLNRPRSFEQGRPADCISPRVLPDRRGGRRAGPHARRDGRADRRGALDVAGLGVCHPEFAEALARAKAVRLRFYEGHLIDIVRRGGDSTRMSAIKLGLLNVGGEDWKERLTAEQNVTFNLGDLIKQSMALDGRVIEGSLTGQSKSDEPGH